MSLVQHITQIEGVDRQEALVDLFLPLLERQPSIDRVSERRLSFESAVSGKGKSIRRVISYDALKEPEELPATENLTGGVTPYKISNARRFAQVVTTVLACWFASGICFGFAALKPILIKEGVFSNLCTKEEIQKGVEVCFEQDLRLNFFFSLASTTANVSALPIGTLLDRYGPRVCFLAGCLCIAVGSVLMSLAFQIEEFDGYTIGNFFLALGGTFIFLPSFQIANAFPKYSGLIVAVVTGAFDASAAIYLFYRLAYEATGGSFNPQTFFLVYLIVPVFIALAQLTFLPVESYKNAPQLEMKLQHAEDVTRDLHSSDDELPDEEVWRRRKTRSARRSKRMRKLDKLVGDAEERKHKEEAEEHRQEVAGVWGALHQKPAHEQMMSPWFIFLALLTVLQMIRMNYFIASIRQQYEYMLNSPTKAVLINDFFDWALPIGGVISTPFLGLMLDNISVPGYLTIIITITTIIGVIGSIPALWAGYINVVLFVFLRPLYYSAMSDYATKVFGFATFGRVYGTIICVSGLFNLVQPGLDALRKSTFDGNPTPINLLLAIAGFVIGIALVVYVSVQTYRMHKKMDDEDAITVTNTEADSVMESLLEEDEPRDYGSFAPNRTLSPWNND
ncbi:MFS general substrate transporter [Polyplosphaeria fusca]|uniref:MFS general substrate transporter n=1 Tax=Polyplosphaeria fusca TaxID=682080 RepID=A0A9P4V4F4_9PLEO|nr:MFS general substrate transporter [Polyplosphaeria fusca]